MSLKERIEQDIKEAMKARNENKLLVLRAVMAALKNKAIAENSSEDFSDEKVINILQSEAKKREDSIRLFKEGSRNDLAEKEEKELEIIKVYLPEQMGAHEVEEEVKKIINSSQAKDFPSAMKAVMAELKGRADGRVVSEAVKKAFDAKA